MHNCLQPKSIRYITLYMRWCRFMLWLERHLPYWLCPYTTPWVIELAQHRKEGWTTVYFIRQVFGYCFGTTEKWPTALWKERSQAWLSHHNDR